jgi:hypothetical protein
VEASGATGAVDELVGVLLNAGATTGPFDPGMDGSDGAIALLATGMFGVSVGAFNVLVLTNVMVAVGIRVVVVVTTSGVVTVGGWSAVEGTDDEGRMRQS